ncbi:type II toxin-antitoxin system RelB/DinJ family antitoxin [Propionimicrobium sp. PCR01-08-3]|uniref:type II toxin-antitoxin system RelB/DinJ family antitoxin n=1 Tax=Propionimicrobium sp. PCR01-08-3 TaxID=3052086 RepID=UPI00255C792C|nr:type II toxin-antitoxin system RelB/DinJ family antitoxin [Propionimicrobium sp. PCR01-08-3]WIY82355.1 type II toxin-antitoxin system RelB/DinJ family antitoxin [Propionimicrobium sp. PCR01-08-3]
MSKSTITVRVDDTTKLAAESLFSELGLNTSVAVNAFLRQAVRERRIPFEITAEPFNSATADAIAEGKAKLADPSTPKFSDVNALRKSLGV